MAGGRKSGSLTRKIVKGKQGRNPDLARYTGNGNILPQALVEREQRQILDRWKAAIGKAVKDLPTIVAQRIHCKRMQLVLGQLTASVARRVHGQRLHGVSSELKRVVARRVHGQRLRPILSELTMLFNRRSHHTELRPVLEELVTLSNRHIHQERLRPVLISLTASVAARVVSPDTISEGPIDAPPEAVIPNGSPSPAPPRTPAAEMPPDQPLAEDDPRARSNTARRTSDGPLVKADEAAVEKDAESGGGDIDAQVEAVDGEGKPGEKPIGAGAAGVSKSLLTIVVEYVLDALGRIVERIRGVRSLLRRGVAAGLSLVARVM